MSALHEIKVHEYIAFEPGVQVKERIRVILANTVFGEQQDNATDENHEMPTF